MDGDQDQSTAAAPTIDWQNDPDFHQLPLNEKHQVLLSIDPDYKALPPQEQSKALNTIHYQNGNTEGTGKQFTGERDKKNQPGFIHSSLNTIGRQIKGAAEESIAPYTKGYHAYEAAQGQGMGTGMSVAAGAARGLAAAMPVDPVETGMNAAKAPDDFKERQSKYGTGYAAVAPAAASATGVDLPQMEHQADVGNKAGVMAEAAVPAAEVAGGEALHIGAEKTAPLRNERRMTKGTEKVTAALDTPPGKGGQKAASMDKALTDTRGDLADLEREQPAAGKGADAFKALDDKIEDRRQAMWDEGHKPAVERHKDAPINMQKVIADGKRSITAEASEAAPEEAVAANKFLDGLNKDRTVESTDKLIREINDDLKGQNSATRYGRLQIRTRQAVVKALRNQLDETLENMGEKGLKDVNRRWGALGEVQDRVRERAVQLFRQESKAGPIPDWVHLYSFMHPSGVIPAIGAGVRLSSLFKPNPGRQLNKGLKLLGSTDLTAPYQAPTPPGWGVPPKGFLPAPATELPGPGAAELAHPDMFPRPNPGVPAARQTYRDVDTGRMQRGFTSQGQPQPVGHTAEGGPMYSAPEPAPQRVDRPVEQRGPQQQYAGTERRSLRDVTGPDPMRIGLQKTLQNILSDPMATAHDKVVAQMQLDDLKAHPFDEPVGNRDFLKEGRAKTEKTMTREEATAASERRKVARPEKQIPKYSIEKIDENEGSPATHTIMKDGKPSGEMELERKGDILYVHGIMEAEEKQGEYGPSGLRDIFREALKDPEYKGVSEIKMFRATGAGKRRTFSFDVKNLQRESKPNPAGRRL